MFRKSGNTNVEVFRRFDAVLIIADKNSAIEAEIRDSEVKDRLTLRGAADKRERLQAAFFKITFDCCPWTDLKGDISPHRSYGRPHQFDGESVCTVILADDGERGVFEFTCGAYWGLFCLDA